MDAPTAAAWDRARGVVELWNRDGVAAMAEAFWAPDIVWEEPPRFPDGGTHRGRDACVKRMEERMSLLGPIELTVVDVLAQGDRMLIEMRVTTTASPSGVPGELLEYLVLDLVERRSVRMREFLEREPAVEALRA